MRIVLPEDRGATLLDLQAAAREHGYEIGEIAECEIQGVMLSYSRPTRGGEILMGLEIGTERVTYEVIERHYCKGDADSFQMGITRARAFQRAIWGMEAGS